MPASLKTAMAVGLSSTHLRTGRNLWLALASLSYLVVAPLAAAEMPRYSVELYCEQVAEVSGGSAMIYNGCIELEQDAYNELRALWASIATRIREYCDDVARISGGSYAILDGCIELELSATREKSTFKP